MGRPRVGALGRWHGACACVLGAGGGRQPKATARGGSVAEVAVAADEKRWRGVGFKGEGERARADQRRQPSRAVQSGPTRGPVRGRRRAGLGDGGRRPGRAAERRMAPDVVAWRTDQKRSKPTFSGLVTETSTEDLAQRERRVATDAGEQAEVAANTACALLRGRSRWACLVDPAEVARRRRMTWTSWAPGTDSRRKEAHDAWQGLPGSWANWLQ